MLCRPLLGCRVAHAVALACLVCAATAAAALGGGSVGPAPRTYAPIAGKQVLFHFHVVGSGGYDPFTPGLQADYRSVDLPSDGGHYLAKEGQEQWFSWSALFPKGFPTQHGWGVFAAWKALGLGWNGEANVRLDVTDNVLTLYTRGGNPNVVMTNGQPGPGSDPRWGPRHERGFALGPLLRGVWQSFVLHVRWSVDPHQGFVELYRSVDGGPSRLLLRRTAVSNLYTDWPAVRYPSQDLYHKGDGNVGTVSDVYQSPMQWGPTLAAALSTPSRQVAEGEWFGDTKSTGGPVPRSDAPVPLPAAIPYPQQGAAPAASAAKPKPKPAPKPAPVVAAKPQPSVVLGRDCKGCRVRIVGNEVAATIASAADGSDTAYWIRRVGSRGGSARLVVDDRIALGSGGPLGGNLAVLQVRDVHSRLIVELYLRPDRSLHLWSPAGGLRADSVNLPLDASVGEGSGRALPVKLTLLPHRAVRVYTGGRLRLSPPAPAVAATADPRYVRIGIDHYDGDSARSVDVVHRGLSVAA